MQSAKERSPTEMRNGKCVGAMGKKLWLVRLGLILSSQSYLGNEGTCLMLRGRNNNNGVCVWRERHNKKLLMYLPTMSLVFAHVLQRSHALLKSCAGSTDNLLSEPCFFSSAVSSDPPLCPLLIFHEKKKKLKKSLGFNWAPGAEGYQSNRCEELLWRKQQQAPVMWAKVRISVWILQFILYRLQRTEGKFHISTSAAINSSHAVSHSTASWLQWL